MQLWAKIWFNYMTYRIHLYIHAAFSLLGQRLIRSSSVVTSPYTQYNGILSPNYVVNNHSDMSSYKMFAPYQNSTLPAALGMANPPTASALMMPSGGSTNTSLTNHPYSLSRLPATSLPGESCMKTDDKATASLPFSSKMLSMQPPAFSPSTTPSWAISRAPAFRSVMAGAGTATTPSSPCSCLYPCYCPASPGYHLTTPVGTSEADNGYTPPFAWPPSLGLTATAAYNSYLGSSEAKESLPATTESS